ncbi:S-adenosylmethionine-dependent nucleotide dehydratase RSAD2-like isoform X2 [Hydra vulgaris]|uniref:S-adenosylmethionine-dependent nucleotide dehydratase RSAD2 n=1 Tax=Hydra vulgaris TaxID=6087 RepID=A0ABM4C8C4_HYDVU
MKIKAQKRKKALVIRLFTKKIPKKIRILTHTSGSDDKIAIFFQILAIFFQILCLYLLHCLLLPLSVNYHFLRTCNYSCGFCFHTAKTSFVLPLDKAKYGLQLLVDNGMEKINFSGGEPFLYQGGRFLGELIRYCKDELKIKSVSVVTNGSKVTEQWMIKYGCYLDIMAVSCDSFNHDVNKKIGRCTKNGKNQFDILHQIRNWCREYNVMFKLNTVVNRFNFNEDMNEQVKKINPIRWKVFQCLAIEAENIGDTALRQVEPFLITDEEFNSFLARHKGIENLVPESNIAMRNSYLILDEYMRFLDNTGGSKTPSKSLLDVGVQNALNKSGFDEKMFFKRGGKYQWSKEDQILEW